MYGAKLTDSVALRNFEKKLKPFKCFYPFDSFVNPEKI